VHMILIVCYTNHTLDQFLEDLLGIGIPQECLVYLGGKFNLWIKFMSLNNQAQTVQHGKADWKIIHDCKATA
jgi:hypothetical protein